MPSRVEARTSAIPTMCRKRSCISGSYDLKPIILSARGSYIHLEGSEEHDLSPIRHIQLAGTKEVVAYCEGDTDEFQRHCVSSPTHSISAGCCSRASGCRR